MSFGWLANKSGLEPVLRVSGLTVDRFQPPNTKFRVIDDVSFQIEKGTIVGLFGESGCGKTTLALALLHLLSPARYRVSGSICIRNRDLTSLSEPELERTRGAEIAMVFQDPMLSLNPVMRICDQVSEVIRAHRGSAVSSHTSEELFRLVGLPDSRRIHRAYPHQLSGGERQRVAIAQALAAKPALLVADEPFTAVDTARVFELAMLFRDLREQAGVSFLLISHSPDVLAKIADRVLVMYAGRVVETGSPQDVFTNPLHPYTKGLMQSMPQVTAGSESGASRRLFSIPGNPPQPAEAWPGCPFEPRCRDRMESCASQVPPLSELDEKRWVRCFRYAS